MCFFLFGGGGGGGGDESYYLISFDFINMMINMDIDEH